MNNPEMFRNTKGGEGHREIVELTERQKKDLGEVWNKVVLGKEQPFPNVERLNSEQLKTQLYRSLIIEIDKLVDEWKLTPDADRIREIVQEQDITKKSQLESKFIDDTNPRIHVMPQFNKDEWKDTHWHSWPLVMRENKSFDCVGGALLGMNLLTRAGIKNNYGVVHGHVINIVRLSNGDWRYVDFRNNEIFNIQPRKQKIAGLDVLEIQHPDIEYQLILLLDNAEVVGTILTNLSNLKRTAQDAKRPKQHIQNIQRKAAANYLQRFKHEFDRVDFDKMAQQLYPAVAKIEKTSEWQQEVKRIELLDYVRPMREYILTLNEQKIDELSREMRTKKDGISALLLQDDKAVLGQVSKELQQALNLYCKNLAKVKEREQELYLKLVNNWLDRIRP